MTRPNLDKLNIRLMEVSRDIEDFRFTKDKSEVHRGLSTSIAELLEVVEGLETYLYHVEDI